MAHHWSNQFENQMSPEEFKKLFPGSDDEPGATGKFPDGKIDPLDEGEIKLRIGLLEGRVVIEFGKQIRSIGFTKEEAISLGNMLLASASKIRPVV